MSDRIAIRLTADLRKRLAGCDNVSEVVRQALEQHFTLEPRIAELVEEVRRLRETVEQLRVQGVAAPGAQVPAPPASATPAADKKLAEAISKLAF